MLVFVKIRMLRDASNSAWIASVAPGMTVDPSCNVPDKSNRTPRMQGDLVIGGVVRVMSCKRIRNSKNNKNNNKVGR